VRASGWLAEQLALDAGGLAGRYDEVSHFLDQATTGWLHPDQGGWEEVPYRLRGLTALAGVTGDAGLRAKAASWVDGILGTAQPDGFFGYQGTFGASAFNQSWGSVRALTDTIHRYGANYVDNIPRCTTSPAPTRSSWTTTRRRGAVPERLRDAGVPARHRPVPVLPAPVSGTAVDAFNAVTFTPVTTTGPRVVARLRDGLSGGILQWTVAAAQAVVRPDTWYRLHNSNSGKVHGVAGMSTVDGAGVAQFADNGTADHLWRPLG
jgi:hypothetical protein